MTPTITPTPLQPQGASHHASSGNFSAHLWIDHTPTFDGHPITTIGDCHIDDSHEAPLFLSACADFLHKQTDCQMVVGPMNGNTWLNHRLILESDGRPPFLMEPDTPAHFLNTFMSAGFDVISRYSSSTIDLTSPQKEFSTLQYRLLTAGVTIRPINLDEFETDLDAIFDLSLDGFSHNFLYTPISREGFVGKYLESRDLIDPDLVLLAERNNQLVGYVFCIPDHLDPQATSHGTRPAIIVKTLTALPERALSGLGTILVNLAQNKAREKGYSQAIHALQFENNSSLRISQRFHAKVFRRYALMAKSFTRMP